MPKTKKVAVDETLFGDHNAVAKARLASGANTTNAVAFVTKNHLATITSTAKLQNQPNTTRAALDKQRLRDLSNARKAKWPNTLEAAREKKLRAAQMRADEREKQRQALDKEEENLQAEKRRLAIERAQRMLYESTDRSKALKTQMLLTDVMQENKLMMELQQQIKERESRNDAHFFAQDQEKLRQYDRAEDEKEEAMRKKKAHIKYVREEQLRERDAKRAGEEHERATEAAAMRLAVRTAEAEEKQEARDVKDKQAAVRADFVASNTMVITERERLRAQVAREDVALRAYAKAKEKDLLERRDREATRFADRLAWRQHLIDVQGAKLTDMHAAQEERVAAQEQEVALKASEARKRLDEKKKDELLVTHMSRQQQMRWKAERREQQRYEDEYYAEQQRALGEELIEEQAQEMLDKYEQRRALDQEHFRQMALKKSRADRERRAEFLEAEETRQWMGDDDAIYERYARMSLDEYVAEGKDPRPVQHLIKKQLRGASAHLSS